MRMTKIIDDLINTLFADSEGKFSNQFFKLSNLKLFMNSDPKLKQEFFNKLQIKLLAIPTDASIHNKEAAIKFLINFIPFALTNETKIVLPILANQGYSEAQYDISRIPLTAKILPNSDQYHTLALTPRNPEHPAQLICMGTAPPSTQGSLTTILADLFPFTSIGWLLSFKSQKLLSWAMKQKHIEVTGQSLGGAVGLAQLKHLHKARVKLSANFYNPALPIMTPKLGDIPINIYVNKGDPVSKVGGRAPLNAKVYVSDLNLPRSSWRSLLTHTQCGCAIAGAQSYTGAEYNKKINTPLAYFTYHLVRLIGFILIIPFYIVRLLVKLICNIFLFPYKYVCRKLRHKANYKSARRISPTAAQDISIQQTIIPRLMCPAQGAGIGVSLAS